MITDSDLVVGEQTVSPVYGAVKVTGKYSTGGDASMAGKWVYTVEKVTRTGKATERRSKGFGKPRKRNPETDAQAMYESFHGRPSEEVIEFSEDEQFHENLAGLGVLVELRVKTVTGLERSIGFETGDGPTKGNPMWPFGPGQPLGSRTTHSHIDRRSGAHTTVTKSAVYKGYAIFQTGTGEFEVPQIDRESRFDTKKDAQRFIDDEVKVRRNHSRAGKSNLIVKPLDKLIFQNHVRRLLRPPYSTMTFENYSREFPDIWVVLDNGKLVKGGDKEEVQAFARRYAQNPGPISSATKFAGDVSGLNLASGFVNRAIGKVDKGLGKVIGFKGNKSNPSIFDYEDAERAGREYAQQLQASTGASPKSIATDMIRKYFKIWWENGGAELATPNDKAGNEMRFVKAFKFPHKSNPEPVVGQTWEYGYRVRQGGKWKTAHATGVIAATDATSITFSDGTKIRQGMVEQTGEGLIRRVSQNPEPISTSTTLLCANESGSQLYLVGGDQTIDLDALKFSEIEQAKELITIGECYFVSYLTQKDFDKFETIVYEHELGEESGVLPTLIYDRLNQRLLLSGGEYHIERPMFETSPGIEN